MARLGEAWDAFIVAVRRARARARTGERDEGLTLSQYELVRTLTNGDGLPSGKLAELAGIAPATATQILDGLERAALIERSRSPGDRRTVTITLTTKGRRQVEQKRRRIADRRRQFFESFAPEERAQTARLLRHITQVISEL
ncbi:MAG: MarR family winged helix-turn-helix transcriptional regulator [Solirubrobacteraceae bacterium]